MSINSITSDEAKEINQLARDLNVKLMERVASIIAPFCATVVNLRASSASFQLGRSMEITISPIEYHRSESAMLRVTLSRPGYAASDIDLTYDPASSKCDSEMGTGALLDLLAKWLPEYEHWAARSEKEEIEDDFNDPFTDAYTANTLSTR